MKHKIIVVLPAYNAEKTISLTVNDIPKDIVDKIILVDDASEDRTFELAKHLGIFAVKHPKNIGYGGNQKTCYSLALKYEADIVVMVHPDYQYDPKIIPYMIGFIKEDICDIVLGNRISSRTEVLRGGMPLWKYLINRFSSVIENIIFGQNLGEWHSGLRAYSKKVLETIPWQNNSDDFVFDQQFLIQAIYFGFRIGDVPVKTRYFKGASSINFKRSFIYGIYTVYTIFIYFLHRLGFYKSKLFISKKK